MELIVFADIVAIVLDHLSATIPDVPMGTLVPSPRPERFVNVRRVGGTRSNIVLDSASLAVEAWAGSPQDASDLAEQCRSVLHAMAGTVQGGVPIYVVDDFSGPADLPDPLSDQPRYTFAVSVTYRGTAPPD